MKVLVIDNYDSFTYNLVQAFGMLGAEVQVALNDEIAVADIAGCAPTHLVISPGPSTPDRAGVSLAAIAAFAGHLPILGVCLGHQAIAQAFGARVVRAARVMHGKTSLVRHSRSGLFANLPNPFQATRYHSLVVQRETLPDCLEITAESEVVPQASPDVLPDIMGLRHKTLDVEGVQFHPESFLTEGGLGLLANFLKRDLPRTRTRTRRGSVT